MKTVIGVDTDEEYQPAMILLKRLAPAAREVHLLHVLKVMLTACPL